MSDGLRFRWFNRRCAAYAGGILIILLPGLLALYDSFQGTVTEVDPDLSPLRARIRVLDAQLREVHEHESDLDHQLENAQLVGQAQAAASDIHAVAAVIDADESDGPLTTRVARIGGRFRIDGLAPSAGRIDALLQHLDEAGWMRNLVDRRHAGADHVGALHFTVLAERPSALDLTSTPAASPDAADVEDAAAEDETQESPSDAADDDGFVATGIAAALVSVLWIVAPWRFGWWRAISRQFARIELRSPRSWGALPILFVAVELMLIELIVLGAVSDVDADQIDRKGALLSEIDRKQHRIERASAAPTGDRNDAANLQARSRRVPEEVDLERLSDEIRRTAAQHAIHLGTLAPCGEWVVEDLHSEHALQLQATGSRAQLVAFTEALAQLPSLISVGDFTLQATGPSPGNGDWQLQADLRAYRDGPDEEASP